MFTHTPIVQQAYSAQEISYTMVHYIHTACLTLFAGCKSSYRKVGGIHHPYTPLATAKILHYISNGYHRYHPIMRGQHSLSILLHNGVQEIPTKDTNRDNGQNDTANRDSRCEAIITIDLEDVRVSVEQVVVVFVKSKHAKVGGATGYHRLDRPCFRVRQSRVQRPVQGVDGLRHALLVLLRTSNHRYQILSNIHSTSYYDIRPTAGKWLL
jgi:hypothetical protein